ncbi:U-box domain-containing protein 62-like [Rutidosis leptorrhynchoides]|uniref:U-box domain-containing protein 62-like n=1 Tax=Rutidosis leptorrhynchoides TaxID=125765 RepID=UPI003A99725C
MASEEISLVLSHCPNNHPQLLFQDDSISPFRRNPPQHPHHLTVNTINNNSNNDRTTRELTGFIEHQNRHYQPQSTTEFRSETGPVYDRGSHGWEPRNGPHSSSDGSDSDDNDNDNDEDEKSNVSKNSIHEKNGNGKRNNISSTGIDVRSSSTESQLQTQLCQYQNAITVADPGGELYYSQHINGVEGSGSGIKDVLIDNGCGFSGRKDVSSSSGSGDSLRTILSDPLTGVLMDDAMILPCGHSFGSSGMQYVMRVRACYTCSQPVSEGSVAPNLSLQTAVQAFRREEELQIYRVSKRRNISDKDRSTYGDIAFADQSRGRGVQFPFCVTERVIIKGNKRTPPRFVGREAVVMTQCLNGWCVVKTLDNAESVKLQYRSLAKVQDSQSSNIASSKISTPNWL